MQHQIGKRIWIIPGILAFLLFGIPAHAQESIRMEAAFPARGIIVDTVRCIAHPQISYAFFHPHGFPGRTKWPVLFVFDPAARGNLAVSHFRRAAETYGYIVIGSNDSKNFLPEHQLEDILNSLFSDVGTRFPVDSGRICTAGFSGGSRIASSVALKNRNISGVIACGAGFQRAADYTQIRNFNYVGLVGERDMNYLEMYDLVNKLDSLGIVTELRTFSGGHVWPSSEMLQEAAGWLELQAMNKGIVQWDETFISYQYQKYKDEAVHLQQQGNLPESVRWYNYMMRDFPDRSDTVRMTADSIRKTKAYLQSLKRFTKNRDWELEMQNNLFTAFRKQLMRGSLPDSSRIWWSDQVQRLRRMEKAKEPEKQLIASRLLMMLDVACYETGQEYWQLKMYKTASLCFLLESLVEPDDGYIRFLLARAYALDNQPEEALRSLEKAVQLGYTNRHAIETEAAFAPLKADNRFTAILKQISE